VWRRGRRCSPWRRPWESADRRLAGEFAGQALRIRGGSRRWFSARRKGSAPRGEATDRSRRPLNVPRRRLALELGERGRAGFAQDRRNTRMATCLTLYQNGHTQREIARLLGIHPATVSRALTYAREQGVDLPLRQKVMLPQYRRLWSTDDLVEKAREWLALYDRPPVSSEWDPWHPHHLINPSLGTDRIQRFYERVWPLTDTIISRKHHRPWKTSWNAYLRAAGFEPLPHGYHYVADDDGKAVRVDGKRLIHSNDHRREYLEGERLGSRRPRRSRGRRRQ
jgi:hypothetical protein